MRINGAVVVVVTGGTAGVGRALALQVDVADSEAVDRAATTIECELGPIAIWVNNAMVSTFAPIAPLTAGEVTESLRVELLHDRSRVKLTMVHLPAVNTPQFDWTLTRVPGRPRPLAPVFQPEVAADAILYAARRAPRELKVGAAVAGTIWLNKFVPGVIDRVLARRGFEGQQEAESAPAHPEGNLFAPVEGDAGAHGRFEGAATARIRGR